MKKIFIFLSMVLLIALSAQARENSCNKGKCIRMDTSNFGNNLSSDDTTAQKVADTLDELSGIGATELSGLSDVNTSTATAGNILVADGTDWEAIGISGDITITSAGVTTIGQSFLTGKSEDSGFTSGDFLLYTDTGDGGALKKVDYDNLPSGGAAQLSGLSDVNTSTATAGNLLIADGADWESITMSGDVTLTSAGVTALATDSVNINEVAFVNTATGTAANILIADGTDFESITLSGDVSITSAGVTDVTFVNTSTATAANLLIADGTDWESIGVSGDATISSAGVVAIQANAVQVGNIDFINTSTATAGNLLISDGTDWESIAMSGDCTITSAGAIDCSAGAETNSLETVMTGVTLGEIPIGTSADTATYNTLSGAITLGSTGVTTIQANYVTSDMTSFINTSTATAGNILIGDGTDWESITISGDVTLTSAGVATIPATFISGKADVTSTDSDYIIIWDATDSALKKVDMSEVRGGGSGSGTYFLTLPVQSAKLTGGDITNSAGIDAGDRGWKLLLDDSTAEEAVWQFPVDPNYSDGTLSLDMVFTLASTQTGVTTVGMGAKFMCATDGHGEWNADGYSAQQTIVSTLNANQTAGFPVSSTITFTQAQADGFDVGQMCRMHLTRLTTIGGDPSGDFELGTMIIHE